MTALIAARFHTYIGSSVLTDPIWFKLGDNHVVSASNSNTAGTVCGILAGIVAIALGVVALYVYQRRRTEKSANGVAFENPSYLREVNMEHVQVSLFLYVYFLKYVWCERIQSCSV